MKLQRRWSTMSKKNNNGAPSLDLGLGAILADAEASAQPAPGSETPAPTEIITLDDAAGELRNEFTTLAEAKQWGVLVSKAETAISSEDDFEARLWWIRGHLGALSLPVSLLAAPFETLCRQLQTRPDVKDTLSELLSEIGRIMLERLAGVGDRRQEHGVRHALTQLGLLSAGPRQSSGSQAIPPKVPQFELGTPAAEVDRSRVPPGLVSRKERNASRRLMMGSLALLLLVGVAVYYFNSRHMREADVVVASESFVPSESATAQMSPIVSARAATGSLGALYYSIAEATPDAVVASSARPPAPGGGAGTLREPTAGIESKAEAGRERPPASDKPIASQDSGAARAKEQVNTNGPIEGPDFQRGIERRSSQEPRLPGAAGPEISVKPVPGTMLPEVGGALMGEVKSVLVPTNVLASPSYHARVIARLREGDKVSVEARVGQWVRIRSRRGKTGFIFAQDVGEPEDFTTVDGQ